MTRLLLLILFFLCSCQENQVNMSNTTIIPKPVRLIITDGFFNLNEKVELLYDSIFFNEASYIKTNFPFKYGKNTLL